MAQQAFVISFYAEGERRASDCYGDFVATRSEAHEIGREYVGFGDWMARYTVRRVWLPNDFGTLGSRRGADIVINERSVVKQELDDSYIALSCSWDLKIIRTSDDQDSIDAAVSQLNAIREG